MKKFLIVLFSFLSLVCKSQRQKEYNFSFVNQKFKAFFLVNRDVETISFYYSNKQSRTGSVYTRNDSLNNLFRYLNFNFIGDSVLFEKFYGPLQFPDTEFEEFLKNKRFDTHNSVMTVSKDSVKIKSISYRIKKQKPKKDEIVFTKVEIYGGYKGGAIKLKAQIQKNFDAHFSGKEIQLKDSTFIFQAIIPSKDSCLQEVRVLYGEESFFKQFIIEQLYAACQWEPAYGGGRPVKAWRRIFVRLNSDRSITVAYPEG